MDVTDWGLHYPKNSLQREVVVVWWEHQAEQKTDITKVNHCGHLRRAKALF